MKMPPHRYSKVNDQKIVDIIVETIGAGSPIEFAAERAGVSRDTYLYWMRKGREAETLLEEGKPVPAELAPYYSFLNQIKKAQNDAVVVNCAIIQQAARKSWQAAAWWLERTKPEHFAQKSKVNMQHEGEVNVNSQATVANVAKDADPLEFAGVVTRLLEEATGTKDPSTE